MANATAIETAFYPSGPVVAILLSAGAILCGLGIDRTNRKLLPLLAQPPASPISRLRTALVFAWPITGLVLLMVVFNRDFSWSALLAMLPTLLILPPVLMAVFTRGPVRFCIPAGLAVFLAMVMLVFFGAGLGMDREFSRLDGHFILTLLLLFLWQDRTALNGGLAADSPLRHFQPGWSILWPVGVYLVGGSALLLGSFMAARLYDFSPGVVFGVLLSLAWSVSLTRVLVCSGGYGAFLIPALPLAIGFLIGPLVLLVGDVSYPISLWQMETGTGLLVAVLWCGLAVVDEPLDRWEKFFLLLLYPTYLSIRIFKL